MFLNRKKLHIWEFFYYLFYLQPEEEEVEEEPMSEESDVDLDMEGVVEVNCNNIFFFRMFFRLRRTVDRFLVNHLIM